LALRTAEHAATHLNWNVAGQRVATILNDVIRGPSEKWVRHRAPETIRA
jgi:hypothetical protein